MKKDNDKLHWGAIVNSDQQRISEQFLHWSKVNDKVEILRNGLHCVPLRGVALRLLLLLDNDMRKAVFDILVNLASVGHSDIQLCRDVIQVMPRKWVLDRIMAVMDSVLRDNPDDYEVYRRYAELLNELDQNLLRQLVERAALSSDIDVQEVASDFME